MQVLSHIKLAGIPLIYWYGTEGDYNVMVMDLLGSNIEALFARKNHKFSLKTLLLLADQMVSYYLFDSCKGWSVFIQVVSFIEM